MIGCHSLNSIDSGSPAGKRVRRVRVRAARVHAMSVHAMSGRVRLVRRAGRGVLM